MFQQCLVPLTMLPVEGSSETRLFRHLFNYLFRVRNSGKKSAVRVMVFWKCSKFNVFFFLDSSIWIGLNMGKVLWFWFQQCLVQLSILVVQGSSETGAFRHLFNYVFRVRNSGKTLAMRVMVFWKFSKFNLDFKIAEKTR